MVPEGMSVGKVTGGDRERRRGERGQPARESAEHDGRGPEFGQRAGGQEILPDRSPESGRTLVPVPGHFSRCPSRCPTIVGSAGDLPFFSDGDVYRRGQASTDNTMVSASGGRTTTDHRIANQAGFASRNTAREGSASKIEDVPAALRFGGFCPPDHSYIL